MLIPLWVDPGTFDGVWFRCLKHREFARNFTLVATGVATDTKSSRRRLKILR